MESKEWNVETKKLYLYENETRIDNDVIRAARVKARDTDPYY